MDWSIFGYFLAAVVAAGVGYVFWPKPEPTLPSREKDAAQGELLEDSAAHLAS